MLRIMNCSLLAMQGLETRIFVEFTVHFFVLLEGIGLETKGTLFQDIDLESDVIDIVLVVLIDFSLLLDLLLSQFEVMAFIL